MTLLKQPFSLDDIQKRSVVVVCAFLFMIIFYLVNKLDTDEDGYKKEALAAKIEARVLQVRIDSMNRDQILLYRALALERQMNLDTDSLLRAKTQEQVQTILRHQNKR